MRPTVRAYAKAHAVRPCRRCQHQRAQHDPQPGYGRNGRLIHGRHVPGGSAVSLSKLVQRTSMSHVDRQSMKDTIVKQQRMLLFLRHCAKCNDHACPYRQNCKVGKELWSHIMQCTNPHCQHSRCLDSRELLRHYQSCQQDTCPICGPVKEFVKKNANSGGEQSQHAGTSGAMPQLQRGSSAASLRDMHGNVLAAHQVGGVPAHAGHGQRRPPPLPMEQPPLKRANLGPSTTQFQVRRCSCVVANRTARLCTGQVPS